MYQECISCSQEIQEQEYMIQVYKKYNFEIQQLKKFQVDKSNKRHRFHMNQQDIYNIWSLLETVQYIQADIFDKYFHQ